MKIERGFFFTALRRDDETFGGDLMHPALATCFLKLLKLPHL